MVTAQDAEKVYELSLEQLLNAEVVSASRFIQKTSEAPSAIDVVMAEDIRSFGWRTLADALNGMRGLYIRNDRGYQQAGSRGFLHNADFNSRMLLMVDGRRMNDNVYDSAFLGEEFMIDMNLIERIEYIPGPGSSLYGANALVGVINVITKKGKKVGGARLSGEAGSLDTYRGRATYGKEFSNGADLLVNASQYYSDGANRLYFPEYSETNGGIAENADQEHSRRLFGQFNYQDLTLRSGYMERFKRLPTAPFETLFNDNGTSTDDRQAYVDLDYNTVVGDDLGLEMRAFYHHSKHLGRYPRSETEGNTPASREIEIDEAIGNWRGGEAKLMGILFDHHKWTLGMEFQQDQDERLYFYSGVHGQYQSNREGWRGGVYVQDEYRIRDNLLINAGVRLDRHHMIDKLQINPRVGIIWDITPFVTTKLLYSSAFRAPNVYERDLDNPEFGFRSNPYNKEEHIKSYESIIEWRPGAGYRVMASFFHNDFSSLLEHQEDDLPPAQFTNGGKFHSNGFELEIEKHWQNGRLLKLAWTYSNVRDDDQEGIWAADSPKNVVKLHYSEPLFEDMLRLGFEDIFVDQRRTLASNTASAYHLFNINLSTKQYHGLQASLGIYNVLDQQYSVLGGREHVQDTLSMDGRTVRFRLEYGF